MKYNLTSLGTEKKTALLRTRKYVNPIYFKLLGRQTNAHNVIR